MAKIDISELSTLLVEASSTQSKIISNLLKNEGVCSLESVTSGTEALQSIEHYQPDLIISGMYLPDMTATELMSSIKATEKNESIPFILISSETRFSALDPIRQSGVVAILPKPFKAEDLATALKTTLEFIDPEEINLEHYDIENIRVLVVDDSLMARKHISRVLNNMGITQITAATNGREGVEIFSANEGDFDLIVTDYNMPQMDGQALIEYIRQDLGNTFIPILMVTSEEDETRLNKIKQAGVSAICDKPFDPAEVKELLLRLMA